MPNAIAFDMAAPRQGRVIYEGNVLMTGLGADRGYATGLPVQIR